MNGGSVVSIVSVSGFLGYVFFWGGRDDSGDHEMKPILGGMDETMQINGDVEGFFWNNSALFGLFI